MRASPADYKSALHLGGAPSFPLSIVHSPFSIIHYPLSTIHYPLSIIHPNPHVTLQLMSLTSIFGENST